MKRAALLGRLSVLLALTLLAGCGGGGGGSSGSSSSGGTTTPVALTNFTTVTVDAGPSVLAQGPNGYIEDNVAYVTITLCAPGSTTNCQTIDHVQLDTGSVGLRVFQSVLNATLLSALPNQTDTSSNPVGECYGFVDSYMFGSVRTADFSIGGEKVSSLPFQVAGDDGAFAAVPSLCSSGSGTDLNTVTSLGANGLLGIGATTTDCGSYCTVAGGYGTAIYYDCPSMGCSAIIGRTASASAPFQQLINPIVGMPVDNNGSIISLPAAPAAGETSLTGTLYFGIGTQTNNTLGSATVLTTTTSSSTDGAGFVTALYNGQTLADSYIDSGSSLYLFVDTTITPCTGTYAGYYCPASPLALSPTIQGTNNASASAAFTLYNAATALATNNSVTPGLGANPDVLNILNGYPNSFDFGLPFFFGRNVYLAIEGRTAGGTTGPYVAF
jgi:hypothetical protein